MTIKSLCDFSFEAILTLTVRHAKSLVANQNVWDWVYEVWCYVARFSLVTQELYYEQLTASLHTLSHDCSIQSISADEVLQVMICCQNPKLILNYRLKRQRLTTFSVSSLFKKNATFEKYFCSQLIELDFSGADFCCDDSLLISLLPLCKSLSILRLGNAGSKDVLNAAKDCPLTKLELEERFPLQPKLPQSILLSYILGFEEGSEVVDKYLELLKKLVLETEAENIHEKKLCAIFLESFPSKCNPTWPKLITLIFGNCRLCREAAFLCILVLTNLQEISIHRIQSDEILNTCDRIFNAVGVRYETSLRRLNLYGKWAGLKNETLTIAPEINDVSFLAFGFSRLNLEEIFVSNSNLMNLTRLGLVGLRNAGPSELPLFLSNLRFLKILELTGAILTTEELVHVLSCFPTIVSLQLHYSEVRNHTYVLPEKKSYLHNFLNEFSIQTSHVDYEWLKTLFTMAPLIKKLCIRGKTRNFKLSSKHQQIFLQSSSCLTELELYPIYKYNLDVPSLIELSNFHKVKDRSRLLLKIPMGCLSNDLYAALSNSGWTIIPMCSRCS